MSRDHTSAATTARCLLLLAASAAALTVLLGTAAPELARLAEPLPAYAAFDALLARGAAVAVLAVGGWLQVVVLATVAEVLAASLTGRRLRVPAPAPRALRSVLLALCGATAVVATAVPAQAAGSVPAPPVAVGAPVTTDVTADVTTGAGQVVVDLSGLPLPERFAGRTPVTTSAPSAPPSARPSAAPAPTSRPAPAAAVRAGTAPSTAAAPTPASRVRTAPVAGGLVVRPGDTLWHLAAEHLVAPSHRDDDAAVAEAVRDLHAANAALLPDPDLLLPGQELVLPGRATTAGAER